MNANTHPAQSTPQSVKVSPLDTADSALEMTPIRTEGPGVESSPDTLSLLMVGHPTQLLNFEDRLRVDLSLDNDKALFEAIEKHFSKAKGYHRFPGIKKIQSCHFSLVSEHVGTIDIETEIHFPRNQQLQAFVASLPTSSDKGEGTDLALQALQREVVKISETGKQLAICTFVTINRDRLWVLLVALSTLCIPAFFMGSSVFNSAFGSSLAS